MSGFAWCRFCGGIGQADRMVCASQSCMDRDLTEQMHAGLIDWHALQKQMAKTISLTPIMPNTHIIAGTGGGSTPTLGVGAANPHYDHVHVDLGTAAKANIDVTGQWQSWRISNS